MTFGGGKFERWYTSASDLTVLRRWLRDNRDLVTQGGGGTTPPPTNTRASLVFGTDKPTRTTTGVISGTTLTNFNASTVDKVTLTTPNLTFTNLRFYGDVHIQADNLTFNNCEFVGGNNLPTSATGVIDCNAIGRVTDGSEAKFIDCTIVPRRPSYYRDCIVGHGYRATRCYLKNGTDGFGIFNRANSPAYASGTANARAHVTVEGCMVEELVYWRNDPAHTDGTHNDCIQVQGGEDILIIGNYLVANTIPSVWEPGYSPTSPSPQPGGDKTNSSGVPDLFPHANGVGILIQRNSVLSPLARVVATKNWVDDGLASISMKPGSYEVSYNRLGRNQYPYTSTSKYPIRGDSSTTTNVVGLNVGPQTNVWEDNGALLTQSRTGGIRWNDIPD